MYIHNILMMLEWITIYHHSLGAWKKRDLFFYVDIRNKGMICIWSMEIWHGSVPTATDP